MTDLERELTDLFDRKGREFGTTPTIPRKVVRKVRWGQAVIASMAALMTGLLAVAGVAGVHSLGGRGGVAPAASPTGQVTTQSSGGVAVTYPKGWRADSIWARGATYVGAASVTAVLPIVEVSNFHPPATILVSCRVPQSIPSWGVLVYVEQDMAFPGQEPPVPGWPPPGDGIAVRPPSAQSCAPGTGTGWKAADRVFEAFLIAGPRANQEDRDRLLAVFRSMEFTALAWPSGRHGPLRIPIGPDVPIQDGSLDGDPWTVVARATLDGPCLELRFPAGTGLNAFVGQQCPAGAVGPGVDPDIQLQYMAAHGVSFNLDPFRRTDGSIVTFVWGEVVPGADRVTVALDDGRKVEASIASLSGENRFLVFVAAVVGPTNEGNVVKGRLTVLDQGGRPIGAERFSAILG